MIYFQPLAVGIPLTFLPNMVIGLRVYALYGRNKVIGTFLVVFLLAELGVALWLYLTPSLLPAMLPGPESITNNLALHVCLATNSPKLSNLQAAAYQLMQTAYDSSCLGLTLWMTLKESMNVRSVQGIKKLIYKHGIIYYVVVFSLNLTWALMILHATAGLKYTMSGATLALAPVAANRLILSLRSYTMSVTEMEVYPDDAKPLERAQRLKRQDSWIGMSTLEIHDDLSSENSTAYELDYVGSGSGRRSSFTRTHVA